MSEINARWARDQRQFRTLGGYLGVIAAVLWTVSYYASFPIYTMPQWQWFSAVSGFTLIGALGCSIGTLVAGGIYLTNEKPLPGSNY